MDELRRLFLAQGVHEGSTNDNHDRVALRRSIVGSTRVDGPDLFTRARLGKRARLDNSNTRSVHGPNAFETVAFACTIGALACKCSSRDDFVRAVVVEALRRVGTNGTPCWSSVRLAAAIRLTRGPRSASIGRATRRGSRTGKMVAKCRWDHPPVSAGPHR
jgi:hypothetical protein